MTDEQMAAQIEAMRDDPDAWGEPSPEPEPEPKRKSERRQRGAMVSVRFSPDELATVQEHATDAGMSVSGYLRDLALDASRQPIVTMAWLGATTINTSTTDERDLLREVQGTLVAIR
jgi:hypothetical protein